MDYKTQSRIADALERIADALEVRLTDEQRYFIKRDREEREFQRSKTALERDAERSVFGLQR